MSIRPYRASDRAEWLRLRRALWPELLDDDRKEDLDADEWLARPDAGVLVVERPSADGLCGFVEVGERLYADGCDTTPVAYIEGWFVDPDVRRQGLGTALLLASEAWARTRGYRELASDTELANSQSHHAHTSLGFIEVERSIKYRKVL